MWYFGEQKILKFDYVFNCFPLGGSTTKPAEPRGSSVGSSQRPRSPSEMQGNRRMEGDKKTTRPSSGKRGCLSRGVFALLLGVLPVAKNQPHFVCSDLFWVKYNVSQTHTILSSRDFSAKDQAFEMTAKYERSMQLQRTAWRLRR